MNRSPISSAPLSGAPLNAEILASLLGRARMEAESERLRLSSLLAHTPVVLWSVDKYGVYTHSEGRALELLGLKPGELVGKSYYERHRDRPHLLTLLERSLAGETFTEEVTYDAFYFESYYAPLRDGRGEIEGVVGVSTDITARRQAQLAVEERELQYRSIFESSHDAIFIFDENGFLVEANPAACEMHGYLYEELIGKHGSEIIESYGDFQKFVSEVRQGRRLSFVGKGCRKDGSSVIGEVVGSPLFIRGHLHMLAIVRDVTQRTEAEEALRMSETRYMMASRATRDAVWDLDLTTNEIIWNDAIHVEFGFPRRGFAGDLQWWIDNIHPEDSERVNDALSKVVESGETYFSQEYRFRKHDGSYCYVLDRGYVMHNSAGKPLRMIGAMQDITDRRMAEVAMREREGYFRNLLDTSPAMIWLTNKEGDCVYLSRNWCDFTGRTAERDLGLGWLESLHPEDHDRVETAYFQNSERRLSFSNDYRMQHRSGEYRWVMDSGRPRFDEEGRFQGYIGVVVDIHDRIKAEEAVARTKDRFLRSATAVELGIWYGDLPSEQLDWSDTTKEHFWLERHEKPSMALFYERLHPEDRERVRSAMGYSIKHGASFDIEYRTVSPHDPQLLKWIRAIGWTDYDSHGAPIRFDGITLDVTPEKRLRDELLAAIQARDEFLSIASHELKSPLTSIKLQTQMTRRNLQTRGEAEALAPDKMRRLVEQTDKSVERLGRLVDDMLDISRIATGRLTLNPVSFNLCHSVVEVADRLSPLLAQARCKLDVEACEDIQVYLDQFRIEQVLTNLLTNAARYGAGKPVHLRVNRLGDYVHIRVKDHGRGIEKKDQERIFNRFERAIAASEISGMGLGLHVVRHILEMHGGSVRVESEIGKGSEFLVSLPISMVEVHRRPAVLEEEQRRV
jgi:PAS domain S-box-containing protein